MMNSKHRYSEINLRRGRRGAGHRRPARRGLILVVVLMIISVLGLLAASFSFRMNADFAAVNALQDQQQAAYAARAGIDSAIELLRSGRVDQANWFSNYQRFRRIPVYMPGDRESEEGKGGSQNIADQEKVEGKNIWRYSLVAYERSDQEEERAKIRYGLTDEASKVNLNIASRSQLLALFDAVKHVNRSSEQLADALIDWRDQNDEPMPRGAESSHYLTLTPAYHAKNGPLSSVEELLLIKGFDGRLLYGEDYNRNGYLDPNEDDGEEEGLFPPDDGDGQLNQGLYPFITIYSWDWNRSNDNKLRVDINTIKFNQVAGGGGGPGGDQSGGDGSGGGAGGTGGLAAFGQKVPKHITEELRPEVIDFIAEAQQRGYKFKSVGDLLGLEVFEDGSSNHDVMWRRYARQFRQAEARVEDSDPNQEQDEENENADDGQNDDENQDGMPNDGGDQGQNDPNDENDRDGARRNDRDDQNSGALNRRDRRGDQDRNDGDNDADDEGDQADDKDDSRRQQSVRPDENADADNDQNADGNQNPQDTGDNQNRGRRPRGRDRQDAGGEDRGGQGGQGGQNGPAGRQRGRGGRRGRGGQGSAFGGGDGRDPGTPIVSPVEASDMAVLVDRLSIWNTPLMAGLVNVNTAPATVLRTISGLEEDDVQSIIGKRPQVEATEKLTPAWLVSTGAISPEKFALISNLVTTRSIQFTIDSIGFADHVGTVKRYQAVVEMRGELVQIKYFRDITALGVGFPVWDDERSEGFAFSDR